MKESYWVVPFIERWASFVRDWRTHGYPTMSTEHRAIYGRGGGDHDWPDEVQRMEGIVRALSHGMNDVIVAYFLHRMTKGDAARRRRCAIAEFNRDLDHAISVIACKWES